LNKLKEDPDTVINLGDSAYNRSKIKKKLGIQTPIPLPKNGTQQEVKILFLFFYWFMFALIRVLKELLLI
jgi:hypothetical protein